MIQFASQSEDSMLAFSALEFIEKWMVKRRKVEAPYKLPPDELHELEQLVVDVIQIARKSCNIELLDRAWIILKQWRRKVSSVAYIAKLNAYASFMELGKALDTLRDLESSYEGSSEEDAHLFSPFAYLYPLVMACSQGGAETLDKVCRLITFC